MIKTAVDCMCDDIAAEVFTNSNRERFQKSSFGSNMRISFDKGFEYIQLQTQKGCLVPYSTSKLRKTRQTGTLIEKIIGLVNTLSNSTESQYAFHNVYTLNGSSGHAMALFAVKAQNTVWLLDPHSDMSIKRTSTDLIAGTSYKLIIPYTRLQSTVSALSLTRLCTNLCLLPIWVYVRLQTQFECEFQPVLKHIEEYVRTHSKEQCEQLLRNFAVIVHGGFVMPVPRLPLNNQARRNAKGTNSTSASAKSGRHAGSVSTRSSPRT
jgi:hypothetical protein